MACHKKIKLSSDLLLGWGRLGRVRVGIEGGVMLYTVRKFVLCREGEKCRVHFNFER